MSMSSAFVCLRVAPSALIWTLHTRSSSNLTSAVCYCLPLPAIPDHSRSAHSLTSIHSDGGYQPIPSFCREFGSPPPHLITTRDVAPAAAFFYRHNGNQALNGSSSSRHLRPQPQLWTPTSTLTSEPNFGHDTTRNHRRSCHRRQ